MHVHTVPTQCETMTQSIGPGETPSAGAITAEATVYCSPDKFRKALRDPKLECRVGDTALRSLAVAVAKRMCICLRCGMMPSALVGSSDEDADDSREMAEAISTLLPFCGLGSRCQCKNNDLESSTEESLLQFPYSLALLGSLFDDSVKTKSADLRSVRNDLLAGLVREASVHLAMGKSDRESFSLGCRALLSILLELYLTWDDSPGNAENSSQQRSTHWIVAMVVYSAWDESASAAIGGGGMSHAEGWHALFGAFCCMLRRVHHPQFPGSCQAGIREDILDALMWPYRSKPEGDDVLRSGRAALAVLGRVEALGPLDAARMCDEFGNIMEAHRDEPAEAVVAHCSHGVISTSSTYTDILHICAAAAQELTCRSQVSSLIVCRAFSLSLEGRRRRRNVDVINRACEVLTSLVNLVPSEEAELLVEESELYFMDQSIQWFEDLAQQRLLLSALFALWEEDECSSIRKLLHSLQLIASVYITHLQERYTHAVSLPKVLPLKEILFRQVGQLGEECSRLVEEFMSGSRDVPAAIIQGLNTRGMCSWCGGVYHGYSQRILQHRWIGDAHDAVGAFIPVMHKVCSASCARAVMSEIHLSDSACANCKKLTPPNQTILRCGKCKINIYCSKDCQRDHWVKHKASCVPKSKQFLDEVLRLEPNKLEFHTYTSEDH